MTDWVDFAYTIVALLVAALLVYVMQKTEHDRVNKFDSPQLQWFRRMAFIGAALALLYSIFSTDWHLTCLLLVSASGILLAVNAIALQQRTPPTAGKKMWVPTVRRTRFVARLASFFSVLR